MSSNEPMPPSDPEGERSTADDGLDYDVPSLYQRTDIYDEAVTAGMAGNVEEILRAIGEDLTREGLEKTPRRVAKAYQFLTHGYALDADAILRSALFEEDYSEMILVRDIEVYSLCEHHMLPFYGRAHVAYIPDGRIVGLSKLPRVVEVFARRLQVQERLTEQIARAIQDVLKPQGVGVVIEAMHLCMMMRGVEKQNSKTVTSAMKGTFLRDLRTREEFLRLLRTNSIAG
jgi:GTP cyclohydrolase IA